MGDTFLDTRKILEPPLSPTGRATCSRPGGNSGRSSTGPWGRWSGNRHRKRFGEIQGHKWKTVVGSPLLMWRRHSVKRKTGGDRTQRRNEGRSVLSSPRSERGKCLRADEKTNTFLLLFLKMKAMRRAQLLGNYTTEPLWSSAFFMLGCESA